MIKYYIDDADIRYFPTESGALIKALSIPTSVYGQQISKKSFILSSSLYYIVDDANGNIIDQHNSYWMNLYGDLTVKPGCKENYYTMIQQYDDIHYTTTSFQGGRIYIPLQFWFCRNITTRNSSLVLPLCSLYNSTIELSLDIRSFNSLIVAEDNILTGAPNLEIENGSLLVDYVI